MYEKTIHPYALVLLVLISCKKNTDETNHAAPVQDPYKDEFVACNCSGQLGDKTGTGEYIKAEINGVPICADIKEQVGDDYIGNMLKYGNIIRKGDTTNYDILEMVRLTKDGRFLMAIYLENTHALTEQYPFVLPRPNPGVCEIGELDLQNQTKITPTMCDFCPDNFWHYYGSFSLYNATLKMVADKFENGIFEGHFSGGIRTGSGRIAYVTNGSFRIKLNIFRADIIIP
jgi:hypothetical protein